MFKQPVTFAFDSVQQCTAQIRRHMLNEMAANGIRNVVLGSKMISAILSNPGFESELAGEVEAVGMKFVDSHSPFGYELNLNVPDPGLRRRMVYTNCLAMEIAASLGVDTIAVHIGSNHEPPLSDFPIKVHFDRIRDALDQLLPVAERLGITICIENIWFPINTADRLLEIKAAFDTPALGFCYDSGHANILAQAPAHVPGSEVWQQWQNSGCGEPPLETRTLEKMLPHVVNCHLHDNDGSHDQHLIPGRGNIDWTHIIALLKQAPRLKCIQSEVLPIYTGEPIRPTVEAFTRLAEL